jgi:hypothetical protein
VNRARSAAAAGLVLLAAGCATPPPPSFTRTNEAGWAAIELRDGVDFDRAWDTLFRVLAREFDFAVIEKDQGYLQTAWHHAWSGVYQEAYRVRVTALFGPDRRSVQIRSEAWALVEGRWHAGSDARLLSTVKTDLMGTIGRTTR